MTDSSPVPATAAEGRMTYREAAVFLNEETTWAPGWRVQATYHETYPYLGSNDVSSHLLVTLHKKSKNSSAPGPDGTYAEPWELIFPLGVPDHALKDKDALVFWLLEKITWCDEHENREFARYKKDGQWYAPFHPHRGEYRDQHRTPEWRAQYRDPADRYIAGRKPALTSTDPRVK